MVSSFINSAAVLAMASVVFALPSPQQATATLGAEVVQESGSPTVNGTNVFTPAVAPSVDTNDVALVVPATNITLFYSSNASAEATINVNNAMIYPTVILEHIAAVSNVDCTETSVSVTFNDSTVFAATQTAWDAEGGQFVLITNHLGDCDVELERGFFLVSSLEYDTTNFIITAEAASTNLSATAETTDIIFGQIPTGTISKRTTSTYKVSAAATLAAGTSIYEKDPYIFVTADEAWFDATVTFSGTLSYSWFSWAATQMYFDIDTEFKAELGISALVADSFNTSFTYNPSPVFYGCSIPGLIQLGPKIQFGIDGVIGTGAASQIVAVSADVQIALADGNIHLDALNQRNSHTSGWTPTYVAAASLDAETAATVDTTATLNVEIAVLFFGGLIDLSTGLTAKPAFLNTFTPSKDLSTTHMRGVTGKNSQGLCPQGLEEKSVFDLTIDAYATRWFTAELYSYSQTIVDQCYNYTTSA